MSGSPIGSSHSLFSNEDINISSSVYQPTWSELLRKPVWLLAFGFGSGLSPKAPGTIGTLAALPFYYFLQDLALLPYLAVLVAATALGVYLCDRCSREMGVHDHGGIVWDEMVGYWLTMVCAPAGWQWMLLGFGLFRFFDIVKPWPIRWVDAKVAGGLGIMLDDIIAAIFAALCLQLAVYWY